MFEGGVMVEAGGPSPEQASELASLSRALAAFDDLDLGLDIGERACPDAVHALLAPVAARLVWVMIRGASTADVGLGVLQRLALPLLLALEVGFDKSAASTSATIAAVAGLDAPRLAFIDLYAPIAGSRAAVVAAVTALAVGRPQPVGRDGRPAGLSVAVSRAALSDEELGSVREAVAAVRGPDRVTLKRPYP
jgi:hypothetical protein